MKNRKHVALVALLAVGLLAMSSASALAWGGHPLPSAHPKPGVTPSHPVASHSLPVQAKGQGHGKLDCTSLPTPSAPVKGTESQAMRGRSDITWGWRMGAGWLRDLDPKNLARCSTGTLTKGVDNRIAMLIDTLGDTRKAVGSIKGLDSTQQANLTAEIDAAIADLNALKTKIDAKPTGSELAADLAALQKESFAVRAIVLQVRLLGSVEGTLVKISDLDAQATGLTAQLAAAPSSVNTAAAQKFLDDMKARIADAQKLATPLPAILLGLTSAQLQAGKADPTIAAAIKAAWKASFDVFKAGQDAGMVKFFLAK